MVRIYLIAIIFKIIAAKYCNTTTTKKKNNVKCSDLKAMIDIPDLNFPVYTTRLNSHRDLTCLPYSINPFNKNKNKFLFVNKISLHLFIR